MLEKLEPQHVFVPLNPMIHLSHLHVADAMVHIEQPRRILAVVFVDRKIAHQFELRQEQVAALFYFFKCVST